MRVQREKKHKKGSFEKGHYIDTVTIPDTNDKWAQYCLAQPSKYPQVYESGHVSPDLLSIEVGTYKHTKRGNLYDVLGVALQTETNEPLVLYRPLHDSKYDYFARPYSSFTETVEIDGRVLSRFEKQPK